MCWWDMGGYKWGRAYDIWGDMGIGIPHKVYLGSAIMEIEEQIIKTIFIVIQ